MDFVKVERKQLDDLIKQKAELNQENEVLKNLVIEKQERINHLETVLVSFIQEISKAKEVLVNKNGNGIDFLKVSKLFFKMKNAKKPMELIEEIGFGGVISLANEIVETVKPMRLNNLKTETKALESGK